MKRFLLLITIILILAACAPRESVIQTKVAETRAAKPTLEIGPTDVPETFKTYTPWPSATPTPTVTPTPTDTPEPTITPTGTPLPGLDTVVVTFEDIDTQLPNFYNEFPADTGVSISLSGLDYKSFEITYLARYEKGNLSITLLLFEDEDTSSAVSSALESEHKKSDARKVQIPDIGLPSGAWQFYTVDDYLTLGFSQGRIVTLFFLKEPLEMVLDDPENFLGATGVVQMERIVEAGY